MMSLRAKSMKRKKVYRVLKSSTRRGTVMTREEAKQNTWKAHCNFDNPRKAIHIVIDQIFNDPLS